MQTSVYKSSLGEPQKNGLNAKTPHTENNPFLSSESEQVNHNPFLEGDTQVNPFTPTQFKQNPVQMMEEEEELQMKQNPAQMMEMEEEELQM